MESFNLQDFEQILDLVEETYYRYQCESGDGNEVESTVPLSQGQRLCTACVINLLD